LKAETLFHIKSNLQFLICHHIFSFHLYFSLRENLRSHWLV